MRQSLTEAIPDPNAPKVKNPKSADKPPRGTFGQFWRLSIRILLIAPVLAAVFIYMPGPLRDTATVIVPHGSKVYDIAASLDASGVTINPVVFRLAAKLLAKDSLQAGEYEFVPHQSVASVVEEMHEGHSVVRLFTAAEGMTSAAIVDALGDIPLAGAITAPPSEGSLLPESYRYSWGDSRAGLIARMQKGMQETLNGLWAKRDESVPLKSPQEALIMASVIEKETGKAEERPRIARVFYNRLQHSMRLQSDPTVIYAITQGKGPLDHPLGHSDLAVTSPYNTYTNDGLPPGPICNPGRAAIEAALHPEPNDYFYFVADGTGGHVFAKDLAEHNQNVAKWSAMKVKP